MNDKELRKRLDTLVLAALVEVTQDKKPVVTPFTKKNAVDSIVEVLKDQQKQLLDELLALGKDYTFENGAILKLIPKDIIQAKRETL